MKKTKRLFLFAGYDKDGIIDDTLVYYLTELSKLGDIVLVMDCEVADATKLSGIKNILHTELARHNEYDFGSYKRGYIWAHDNKILDKYDWVYLVNDSVYLLNTPKRIVEYMEQTPYKMIGVSENCLWKDHIQSWFMGFAPEIFKSDWFNNFLTHVRTEDKENLVLHYEVGLSKLVLDHGFSFKGYTPYLLNDRSYYGIEQYVPFLKKSIIDVDQKYAKKITKVLNIPDKKIVQEISANVLRTKNIHVPFTKKSMFIKKIKEIFWYKDLYGVCRVFGWVVWHKDFINRRIKHLRILFFRLKICYDRKGIAVSLNKRRLFRLHRKKINATTHQIENYQKAHKNTKIRGVVYTCVTGNYENIITHRYLNPNYDYICFTDNKNLLKKGHPVWQIKPLPYTDGDNIANSRFPKLNPHEILKNYSCSLYVDANISIVSERLFKICEKSQKKLLIPAHPDCECIYDECKRVYEVGKETPSAVFKVTQLLRDSGYSREMGLAENNLIWRKHNDETIKKIDNQWWHMFTKYSKRDQLTLGYVLWQNKIPFQNIYMPVHQSWDYVVVPHDKNK